MRDWEKSIGLALLLLGIAWSTSAATRLAVVDVGEKQQVPVAFQDLLLVEFGKHPEVTLLERGQIGRLLHEQALALALSGQVNSEEVVRVGRLCATDVFLMLEADPAREGVMLHIRLVDARYGLKLWDATLALSPKTADFRMMAGKVVQSSVQRILKLSCGQNDPIPIGVSVLRCEELSGRWGWLAGVLTTGLEQHLGLQPRIVVMERSKTSALTEERELAAGLPEALRAASVMVDGSYRINREKGPDILTVHIRCRRNAKSVLDTMVEGSVSNVYEVCQDLSKAIAVAVNAKSECGPMDAEAEAMMLVEQAKLHQKLGDKEEAIALARAAVGLAPESCVCLETLLGALGETCYDPMEFMNIARQLDERCWSSSQTFPLKGLLDRLARRIWGVRVGCAPPSKDTFPDARRSFWSLWERCDRALQGRHDDYRIGFLDLTDQATYPLCQTPEEAILLSRRIVAEAIANKRCVGLEGIARAAYDYFADVNGAKEKFAAYLEEMTHVDDPVFREYAIGQYLKLCVTRQGCEKAVYEIERIMTEPGANGCQFQDPRTVVLGIERIASTFTFTGDWAQNVHYRHCLLRGLVEYGLREEHFAQAPANWTDAAILAASLEEKPEAISLLERSIAALPRDNDNFDFCRAKLQSELQRSRAPLPQVQAPPRLELKEVLRLREPVNPTHGASPAMRIGRRLIADRNLVALIYSVDLGGRRYYGVIRLDPITFHPADAQETPPSFPLISVMYELDKEGFAGPAATDGTNVFVGSPQDGLVVFPSQGQPKLLNENNGLASQEIRSVVELDGKIYALIGTRGVMEVDWRKETSRFLFTFRSTSSDSPLNGRRICAILADGQRHVLWVLDENGSFWSYDPKDGRAHCLRGNKTKPAIGYLSANYKWIQMSWTGDQILLWGPGVSYTMNPTSCVESVLFNGIVRQGWGISMSINHLAKAGDALLALFERDLLCLRVAEKTSESLMDRLFPPEMAGKTRLADLVVTRQGVLLLTDEALYLVPEFNAQPPVAPVSSKDPP